MFLTSLSRRLTAMALAAALFFGMIPVNTAHAETAGPCEHLPTHQEGCNYAPAQEGSACEVCTEVDEAGAIRHGGEGCTYAPPTEEVPCTCVCPDCLAAQEPQTHQEESDTPSCICDVLCGETMNAGCPWCAANAQCGWQETPPDVPMAVAEDSGTGDETGDETGDPPADEATCICNTTSGVHDSSCPLYVAVCDCEMACTEGNMNNDCPVCGAADAAVTACGKYEEPTCNCEAACGEAMNAACAICSAEGADVTVCGKYVPTCNCEAACGEAMNAACAICGAEGADVTVCGKYVPTCNCETVCGEAMNPDCAICGAEGADVTVCGQYVPTCNCEAACGEVMNAACAVCGAEGALPEGCGLYAVEQLAAAIGLLQVDYESVLEDIENISLLRSYVNRVNEAYASLQALSDRQKTFLDSELQNWLITVWETCQMMPLGVYTINVQNDIVKVSTYTADADTPITVTNADDEFLTNYVIVYTYEETKDGMITTVTKCVTLSADSTFPMPASDVTITALHEPHGGTDAVCSHEKVTNVEWIPVASLDDITGTGHYYLSADITLTERKTIGQNTAAWHVPAGEINLCLNDHVVRYRISDNQNSRVIYVESGRTLNLHDCSKTDKQFYTGTTGQWFSGTSTAEKNKTVTGGVITGGKTGYNGGGIYVVGTMNMYGGNVVGNRGETSAGGIYATGTLNIFGGKVAGNYTPMYGGGIHAKGQLNISGGSVEENVCGWNGGGVIIEGSTNEAAFTLSGDAVISGNKADYGAGVYVKDNATFTMKGSSFIKDNVAGETGGAVHVFSEKAAYAPLFHMEGGTIEKNKVTGLWKDGACVRGDGTVYISTGGRMKMTGGTIQKNTVALNGGAIYVRRNAYSPSGVNHGDIKDGEWMLDISGTVGNEIQISENTATNGSGGFLYLRGIKTDLDSQENAPEYKGYYIRLSNVDLDNHKCSESDEKKASVIFMEVGHMMLDNVSFTTLQANKPIIYINDAKDYTNGTLTRPLVDEAVLHVKGQVDSQQVQTGEGVYEPAEIHVDENCILILDKTTYLPANVKLHTVQDSETGTAGTLIGDFTNQFPDLNSDSLPDVPDAYKTISEAAGITAGTYAVSNQVFTVNGQVYAYPTDHITVSLKNQTEADADMLLLRTHTDELGTEHKIYEQPVSKGTYNFDMPNGNVVLGSLYVMPEYTVTIPGTVDGVNNGIDIGQHPSQVIGIELTGDTPGPYNGLAYVTLTGHFESTGSAIVDGFILSCVSKRSLQLDYEVQVNTQNGYVTAKCGETIDNANCTNGSIPLKFALQEEDILYAGTYTGTLTFGVTIPPMEIS